MREPTCPTYQEKFIRDNVVAQFVPTMVIIVTLPIDNNLSRDTDAM